MILHAFGLAALHHIAVFALVAVLAAETALLRPGLTPADLPRLARLDMAYGALAVVVLLIGFSRALTGPKPWDYYASNSLFWGKIIAFTVVGLLSAVPTLRILQWRRQPAALTPAAIIATRRFIIAEWLVLPIIPLLAAGLGLGLG